MGINIFSEDGLSMTLWGPNSPTGRAQEYDPEGIGSTSPNPNPEVFTVNQALEVGRFVVCKVYYPDATTFEGNKIIVLKDASNPEIVESQRLDPHFSEEGKIIARFRPDEEGWELALTFTEFMDQLDKLNEG